MDSEKQSTMPIVTFVRHGETAWDDKTQSRCKGKQDVPLCDKGRKQAKENAGRPLSNTEFDYIFCSPKQRTMETCSIILEQNKYKNKYSDDKLIIEKDLSERGLGEFEGKSIGNDGNRDYTVDQFQTIWDMNNTNHVFKDVEELPDFINRVYNCYDKIKNNPEYQNKKILIVSHGGVNDITHAYFNGVERDDKSHNWLTMKADYCVPHEFDFNNIEDAKQARKKLKNENHNEL